MNKKYNLFIGRWSPFHNAHKYIIDSFIKNGKPVCIAIRDSDDKYPVSIRMAMIKSVYINEIKTGMVKIIVIPDIELVAISRDVGYCIVEVPDNIRKISGTNIRKRNDDKDLPPEVREIINACDRYEP